MKIKKFTIIELLTVIVIFLILVALLLPILSRAKDKAKRLVCLNNIRQMNVLIITYAKNNRNAQLPLDGRTYDYDFFKPDLWRKDLLLQTNLVETSIIENIDNGSLDIEDAKGFEIFECPSRQNSNIYWNTVTSHGQANSGDLSANYLYLGNGQGTEANWERDWEIRPQALTDDNAFQKIVVADEIKLYLGTSWDRTNHFDAGGPLGANLVYLDGHGGWKDREEYVVGQV